MADEKIKKSLERKTKKELIEIIFRKDSVERELRELNKDLSEINNNLSEDKKSLSEKIKTLNDEIDELATTSSASYEILSEDYQNACDENAKLYHNNKRYKKQINLVVALLTMLSIMLVLSLVL